MSHTQSFVGQSLSIESLLSRFAEAPGQVAACLEEVIDRATRETEPVWTLLLEAADIHEQLSRAQSRQAAGVPQPLLGIPFAVKDNLEVAGYPTTAGCPQFSAIAQKTATVVQRLFDAGAILIGKTNMDQFATGLVGTRSPYGACRNPFNPEYISGGSSSGSALAVAKGLVSFSLGTDTAGSGRVPAAFTNIVGFKPTRGFISTYGLIPACRSLDCVSIFSLTCEDAALVQRLLAHYDLQDVYSRRVTERPRPRVDPAHFSFGIPAGAFLEFFGNIEAAGKYHEAVAQLRALGGEPVEIDYGPFARTAKLLYEGPWVAERYAAVGEFIDGNAEAVLPVTRQIIERGRSVDGVSTFRAQYELEALRAEARVQWDRMDLLLLPTTGTIYTLDDIAMDPMGPNTHLGYYTNFVNLLDLCAVAVPNGFHAGGPAQGLPLGVTLLGPAGLDDDLLTLASRLHRATSQTMGATGHPLPPVKPGPLCPAGWVHVAVVGAHLSGEPLNHQLTSLRGRLIRTCHTSDAYRLYALPGTVPPKPGMIRTGDAGGMPQEVEVWALSPEAFGAFVAAIPAPLGIGTIRLADGESVKSFLCESCAIEGATDISAYGGWRNFLKAKKG